MVVEEGGGFVGVRGGLAGVIAEEKDKEARPE